MTLHQFIIHYLMAEDLNLRQIRYRFTYRNKFQMINYFLQTVQTGFYLQFFLFEYVAYDMYDTASRISTNFAYGCDVYANVLEKLSFKKLCMKILSSVYVAHKNIPFLML